jgi:hypothetical protein
VDALLGGAGAEGVGIRGQHGDHISPLKRLEKPTNQLSTSRTENTSPIQNPRPRERDGWKEGIMYQEEVKRIGERFAAGRRPPVSPSLFLVAPGRRVKKKKRVCEAHGVPFRCAGGGAFR